MYYTRGYVDRHNHQPCSVGLHGMPLLCTPRHGSWADAALSPAAHSVVTISTIVATLVSLALLRCLYLSPGGGEGDDARHVNVTRTLLLSSNLCFWLNPTLAFAMWHWLPNARWGVVLPLGLIARDIWRVRRGGSALPVVHGAGARMSPSRRHAQRASSFARSGRLGGAALGSAAPSSSSHDRKTFFRALAVAALDVLSRSLRRRSFVRVASVVLLLQFFCVVLWWGAVSAVLSVKVFYEDGFITKFMHAFWLLSALAAGKWATGTLARLLGFVAAGGVASWFGRQAVFVERMEREAEEEEELRQQQHRQQQQQNGQPSSSAKTLESSSDPGGAPAEHSSSHADDSISDNPAMGDAPGHSADRAVPHVMPEAYRTADASAYAPSLDFDEGMDDHYDEDFEDVDVDSGGGTYSSVHASPSSLGSGQQHPSTVKTFLAAGCTFSFGSVTQCGLLGGPAQFLWSCVRNVEGAAFLLQRRRRRGGGGGDPSTFRGMDIAVDDGGSGGRRTWREAAAHWWRRTDAAIRGFVRAHSDLAMSHVAAYYKSYQRAANDVAVLIETSGVESIIHDDITTHMCSSVGHLVAGSTASVFGIMLIAHQNSSFASSSSTLADNDASLLEVLLFSYALCYTILFTALEPLRAAIKAVYVCFAEHPSSLSQAFPLIYQRLSRISEAR